MVLDTNANSEIAQFSKTWTLSLSLSWIPIFTRTSIFVVLYISLIKLFPTFVRQGWITAPEELMARWSLRHKLSNSAPEELHIYASSQRSDRQLLLLSFIFVPQSCRRLWRHPNLEPSSDSCSIPSSCWGLYCTCWGLVQDKSLCEPFSIYNMLIYWFL